MKNFDVVILKGTLTDCHLSCQDLNLNATGVSESLEIALVISSFCK